MRTSPVPSRHLAGLVALLAAWAMPSARVVAQQPYGPATAGSAGITPQLHAVRPRPGDAAFQFELTQAVGGSPAFLVLGTGVGSLPVLGIELLVDPATILLAFGSTTSPGGAGVGAASFPLPIPATPSLTGLALFAQGVVVDVGTTFGFSSSRGLRFSVTNTPAVFVATSILNNDPFHLIDPLAGTILDSGSPPQVDNASGAVFDQSGARIFTASGIRGIVGVGDLSSLPISWSTLYASPASSAYGLQLDDARQLLWTLTALFGGSRELVAIDVDVNSSNYGTAVHSTNGMLVGNAELWAMAPSRNLAAVMTYLPNSITIVDTDPQSPTFLQNRFTQLPVPVDQAGPIALATRVAITPDERWALVTLQGVGTTPTEIARLDLRTGNWFDHNPGQFGTNIGPFGATPLTLGSAPTTLLISASGRFAIVGGFGACGWVGRLDLDPTDPLNVGFTPFQPGVTLANGWTSAMAPDEREIAVATWPSANCALASPQLVRIDVVTGNLSSSIGIPPNSNGSNQNLYTVVYR
ncbi:MAG: hypothetical protein AB7I19_03600 [Planctomycetota bacterium]